MTLQNNLFLHRKMRVGDEEIEREAAGSQMSHRSRSRVGSRVGSRVASRLGSQAGSRLSFAHNKVNLYHSVKFSASRNIILKIKSNM